MLKRPVSQKEVVRPITNMTWFKLSESNFISLKKQMVMIIQHGMDLLRTVTMCNRTTCYSRTGFHRL